MPSKKLTLLVLAAFTVVMMTIFFAVPSVIGIGERGVGAALQSAANFTATEDDDILVQNISDRITTQEK